jgi:hypothetical protein
MNFVYLLLRNAYMVLVGKPEGKRQLGRPNEGGRRLSNGSERHTGLIWPRIGSSEGC